MLNISDAEKSIKENRMLAKKPNISHLFDDNKNYGKEFETWFNDRFYGRDILTFCFQNLKYKLDLYPRNNKIIQGKDHYLFNVGRINRLNEVISKKDIEKKISNIKKIKEFCDSHHIKFYIVIIPVKEDILFDKIEHIYLKSHPNNYQKVFEIITQKTGVNIIYPEKKFNEDKKEILFPQTDHHYTEYGAFLVYENLINIISKNFHQVKPLNLDKDFIVFTNKQPRLGSFKNSFDRPFYDGSNCNELGISEDFCPHDLYYKYFDHKEKNKLHVSEGAMKMSKLTHFIRAPKINLTLVGDSHGGFLMQFLPYTFSDVQMIRINNQEKNIKNEYDFNRFTKSVLDFKTDILIMQFQITNLDAVNKLFIQRD